MHVPGGTTIQGHANMTIAAITARAVDAPPPPVETRAIGVAQAVGATVGGVLGAAPMLRVMRGARSGGGIGNAQFALILLSFATITAGVIGGAVVGGELASSSSVQEALARSSGTLGGFGRANGDSLARAGTMLGTGLVAGAALGALVGAGLTLAQPATRALGVKGAILATAAAAGVGAATGGAIGTVLSPAIVPKPR